MVRPIPGYPVTQCPPNPHAALDPIFATDTFPVDDIRIEITSSPVGFKVAVFHAKTGKRLESYRPFSREELIDWLSGWTFAHRRAFRCRYTDALSSGSNGRVSAAIMSCCSIGVPFVVGVVSALFCCLHNIAVLSSLGGDEFCPTGSRWSGFFIAV